MNDADAIDEANRALHRRRKTSAAQTLWAYARGVMRLPGALWAMVRGE